MADSDVEFLFRLYASTRDAERQLTGWSDEQWEGFLRMQFDLQHAQYRQTYCNPSFDIILVNDKPAGRFYIDRMPDEYRIIDIALLPKFRGQGMGEKLLQGLLLEAEENGTRVTLYVERFNPAINLYRRLGFRVEEDLGVYLFMVRPAADRISPSPEPEDGVA